ncbi:MAG TPA: DoxX family protein [Terriglobia bacterium]|nr:DoxX family protein [Terriglobia bacterium]
MFETQGEPSGVDIGDWALRSGLALVFILSGAEKFSNGPDSPWVKMFHQIGFGDWFRYFTGVVEVAGGILVMIPPVVIAGVALLACAMVGAVLAHVFKLGDPGSSVIPLALIGVMAAVGWKRLKR